MPRARGLLALLAIAIFGDFAGARFAFDDGDAIAGLGRTGKAQHLDRHGGTGLKPRLSLVVDEGANAAPLRTADDEVADAQRATLHQHGGDGAAALVETRLDDRAFGRTIGIGLEIEQLGLQGDEIGQLVEVDFLRRRDLDFERLAAEQFDLHFILQQFAAHALGLGVRLVDLVDRHDDRHIGGAGVRDGLGRLRHHAVIGRDHENDDVRDLGAARAHRRERGVAGGVDEGDRNAGWRHDLIGADVLRDAAGLARLDIGVADRVEKRGLAVIDMAHDGDDRRSRNLMSVGVRRSRTGLPRHRTRRRASPYGQALLR